MTLEVIETTDPDPRPFRKIVSTWKTPGGYYMARLICGHTVRTIRTAGVEIASGVKAEWCRRCERELS